MRPFALVSALALLGAMPARAQSIDRPVRTQEQLQTLAEDARSTLRFRQLGDTDTVARGGVELSVQYGNEMPGVGARFGLGNRVDLGAWGGLNNNGHSGVVGADTKIVLLRQGPSMPVSVALRPSLTALVGAANVWAASAAADCSVSRAFGPLSPYGGLAASTTAAYARTSVIRLDPATAGDTYAYAGVAYRWRAIVVSAEAENARDVSYAVRVGTRF